MKVISYIKSRFSDLVDFIVAIFTGNTTKNHINVYPIEYQFSGIGCNANLNSRNDSGRYSHDEYMSVILRHDFMKKQYLDFIDFFVKEYAKRCKYGDRFIICADSQKMRDAIIQYLATHYTLVSVGDYSSALYFPDIILMTTNQIKQGLYIPGTTTILMTEIHINKDLNLQALGRLRKLPGRKCEFIYLYNREIPEHIASHHVKQLVFADKANMKKVTSISLPC